MLSQPTTKRAPFSSSREIHPQASLMESILERRLLSPLTGPMAFPLVDGIYARNIAQAKVIFTNFSRLFGRSVESSRCEELIQARIQETNGDFLITLTPKDRARTPFDGHNPSIEMRPIGSLGWKIRIGDGFHQPEILSRIGARPLKLGERLAYPISPIPGLEGAAGFDPLAAVLALRNSPDIEHTAWAEQGKSSPELLITRGGERHLISCAIGFWMDVDISRRNGHYAFSRRAFEVQPQYRQQLFVDISSLQNDGTKVPYLESPSENSIKTIDSVRCVMREAFSARSTARKKSMGELL